MTVDLLGLLRLYVGLVAAVAAAVGGLFGIRALSRRIADRFGFPDEDRADPEWRLWGVDDETKSEDARRD